MSVQPQCQVDYRAAGATSETLLAPRDDITPSSTPSAVQTALTNSLIIARICGHLPSPSEMTSFSRINSVFREASIPTLYEIVQITDANSAVTLSSCSERVLACVRVFCCSPFCRYTSHEGVAKQGNSLALLLPRLPNLEALSLGVNFIPVARCTTFHRLKALQINGFDQAVLDFVSELPRLQAVSLRLFSGGPPPALLFKQTCLSSITRFSMVLLEWDRQWMQMLHCLPSLRELSLEVHSGDMKEDIAEYLTTFDLPNLERLCLEAGCTPTRLAQPQWEGDIEIGYDYIREIRYLAWWASRAKGGMPQLSEIRFVYPVRGWSANMPMFSTDGFGEVPLEDVYERQLHLHCWRIRGARFDSRFFWKHSNDSDHGEMIPDDLVILPDPQFIQYLLNTHTPRASWTETDIQNEEVARQVLIDLRSGSYVPLEIGEDESEHEESIASADI